MKKYLVVISATAFLLSCSNSAKTGSKVEKEPVLLTVAGEEVPVSEFKYVYGKNNQKAGDAYSEESLNEYLDLYINFRLKVKEAEELGYDQTKEFSKEFNQYKRQLAEPYLTEKDVTEKLIKEAYDRMKTEVSASHILIRLPEDPSPEDTLNAYNQIKELRKQALEGKDFEELAYKNSQDPSAKKNNGNLGYFSSLQMVYPFEDAAYKTEEGKVSGIIRTRFGYHILKVNDKRPARGEIRVAHIMIRAVEGMNPGDLVKAEQKIKEIKEKLDKGEDWDQLARQFSEDNKTASKGGVLPWISTGRVTPEFEDAAFDLSKPGDISNPVKTPYGWHLIKLIGRKPLEDFEAIKPELKQRISRDSRSDLPKEAFIKRVKKENNFDENAKVVKYCISLVDSSLVKAQWSYSAKEDDKKMGNTIFSINDKEIPARDFINFIEKRQRRKIEGDPKTIAKNMYEDFVGESLRNYEEAFLEEKYPEYKYTLKEYRYGILLFKLMDEKVWTKALKDTIGLRTYFNANKDKYKWKERIDATVLNATDKKTLTESKESYKKGLSLNEIENQVNEEGLLNLKTEEGKFEKDDRKFLSKVDWKKGEYEFVFDKRHYYVDVKQVLPSGPKKFEETRGLLISDYQNKLEKDWIKELREKYSYKLNQEEFDKLVR